MFLTQTEIEWPEIYRHNTEALLIKNFSNLTIDTKVIKYILWILFFYGSQRI